MRIRTVFVVQESHGKNLVPAKKHGTLKILLSYKDTQQEPNIILGKLAERMIDIEEEDFILLIGDPLAIGLTLIAAFDLVKCINVLRWDRNNYVYEVIKLEI